MQISPEITGIAIAGLLAVWVIAMFNGLVRMRNGVQNAWAQIDVQLKRRHDLIPNLVEAVRGYMQHESSLFEAIAKARTQAIAAAGNVAERSTAESAVTVSLGKLLAVSEGYPQLRAAENFQLLQEELTSTENRIAYARQFYNDDVMKYNTAQATFPRNLFARWLGFSPATLFAATDGDRAAVQVEV